MSKNEVTKTTGNAVGSFDYGEDAGTGFEGTQATDLSIPFLAILQSNSPQVEDKDPEGAEPGMLFNTVTKELYDGSKGINFMPTHKEVGYVEWIPRHKGGGFVGLHQPDSDFVKEALAKAGRATGKIELENGNELVETHYVYGLVLNADGDQSEGFVVVSFTSTKIKPYRDWFTAMYTIKGRPPLFANRAVLRTIKQKNEHGTFYNFRIDPYGPTWRESLIDPSKMGQLLQDGKDFREMIVSGKAKAAYDTEQSASGHGGGDGEDAPF